jgi:RNA polymerase sigma factor (sigma-70 family)
MRAAEGKQERRRNMPWYNRRPSKHTFTCLAQRLAELEPWLHSRFPTQAAEHGLAMAQDAGMRYIERVQQENASDLDDGKAYLRKVAFRAARRWQRQEPSRPPIDPATIPSPPHRDVEATGDNMGDVRSALDALPKRQKEAVTLRILYGLSRREAAREMGVFPQTVDRAVEAGLAKLHTILSRRAGENAQ